MLSKLSKRPALTPIPPPLNTTTFSASGDGTIPYLSLSFAFTWLLGGRNDTIVDSYVKRGRRWTTPDACRAGAAENRECSVGEFEHDVMHVCHHINRNVADSGVRMEKFEATFEEDGVVYRTVVIEATGVEHKAITRNEEILETVLSEVFKRSFQGRG